MRTVHFVPLPHSATGVDPGFVEGAQPRALHCLEA
jgi:hypothetical protein